MAIQVYLLLWNTIVVTL